MNNSRTYYYARVSSRDQNLARQMEVFHQMGADDRDIIVDKESGKNLDRPGYNALKTAMLRRGDTLVVKSLDRLSRNKADIKRELEFFKSAGIRLRVLDLPTTMMEIPEGQDWIFDMVNNIIIEVIGTIAEQERRTIRARQAEGIKAEPVNAQGKKYSAKTGNTHGRPQIQKPSNWDSVMALWKAGSITATEAMKRTGMKKTSFYKLVGMTK